jgi:uncharacterized membrane protein
MVNEWAESVREMPVIYHYLFVILISMIPLIEQRGAIPVGIALFGMNPIAVFFASLIGSLIPAPFILLGFNWFYGWIGRFRFFKPLVNFLDRKIRKNTPKLERYKEIGLIIFIGIPLPTTGIWTGSLIAAVMNLKFGKSLICAALGGLISAVAITLLVAFVGWLI